MLTFSTGLLLGLAHLVSGPDHLAAVAPLTRGRRDWRVGLSWGLGHAVGVALVALALWAVGHAIALDQIGSLGERLVGLSLIAVGLWSLRRPEHFDSDHLPHEDASALGIGVLHGVAGGSHLYAALPAVALVGGGTYLGGFAIGAVVGMVGFTSALGRGLRLASPATRHRLRSWLSVTTVLIGLTWLVLG